MDTSPNKNVSSFVFFILGLTLLILIATLRPVGFDQDSPNYATEMLLNFDQLSFSNKEPAYWLIQQLNLLIFAGNPNTFFFAFAVISITIKFYAIKKYSLIPWLGLLCYIAFFYIIQDMTQIRAGVAIGFVFMSTRDIINKNLRGFITKIFLATMFHYSAIIFALLYLIRGDINNRKFFYLSLPILGLIIAKLNLFQHLLFSMAQFLPVFLASKINIYHELLLSNKLETVNPINLGNIFLLCICYFSYYLYSKNYHSVMVSEKNSYPDLQNEYINYSIKFLCIGFFILFSFSFVEVFAYRIANFLFFYLVILIPYVAMHIKPRVMINSLFVLYLTYTLAKNIDLMLNFKAFI